MALNWYERIIAKQIFNRIVKEAQMNGWVTKLTAVASILSGLALGVNAVAHGKWDDVDKAWQLILFGGSIFGIGRKIDKNTTAVQDAALTPGQIKAITQ